MIRLQRLLSQAGVASRRAAEELIVAGRVAVNGQKVTELGTKVDPATDKVAVDGRPVAVEAAEYVILHKPSGYVTTVNDPEGRPTVMQLVADLGVRVYPVGRLDFNSEGLLLLTNDGELAHALMHPSHGVDKGYHLKVKGQVDKTFAQQLRRGVTLDDGTRTSPCKADIIGTTGKHTWVQVILHEGKNRQLRRMAEALGSSVLRLIRVAYGPIELGEMKSGTYRRLTKAEVDGLRAAAGLKRARR